jgi:hypothetical protein
MGVLRMSTVNPQFQQFQIDRNAFVSRAKQDGLNLQQIDQQALSGLPSTATAQQKYAAIQAATQQAVQKTGDTTLEQNYQQLQNDHKLLMQNRPGGPGGKKGHKPPGGGAGGDDSATTIISEGDQASVSDIQSCLSSMKSTDPNYATLQSMLQQAEAREQKNGGRPQQPPSGSFGGVLNYVG